MQKKQTVLLTGVTGFLGRYLAKELLDSGCFIYSLARSNKNAVYIQRVVDALKFVYEQEWNDELLKSIKIVEGDITKPNLGLKSQDLSEVISKIDTIYHCAALTNINGLLELLRKINTEGAKNVFDLGLACKDKGKLIKINHISTVFVVGKREIDFTEDMLELGQDFNNAYEQSKFEAELLAKVYRGRGLKITVFRPSLIAGDSKTGKVAKFELFYQVLHYFSKNIYDSYPVNLECFQNIINVDTTAKIISLLSEENDHVFHVVSPQDIKQKDFFVAASHFFNMKLPEFIPIENFDFNSWSPLQKKLAAPQIPYFNFKAKFKSDKTQAILSKFNFVFPEFNNETANIFFEYCIKKNYIKRI